MPAAVIPTQNIPHPNTPAIVSSGTTAPRDPAADAHSFAESLNTAEALKPQTGATSADPAAETASSETHLALNKIANESATEVSTEETRAKETSAALAVEPSPAVAAPESASTPIEGSSQPAAQNAPAPAEQEASGAQAESSTSDAPPKAPSERQPEVVLKPPQASEPVLTAPSSSENGYSTNTTPEAIISELSANSGRQLNDTSIQKPAQPVHDPAFTSAIKTNEHPPVSSNLKTVGDAPSSQPSPETGPRDTGATRSLPQFASGDSKNDGKNSGNDNPAAHDDPQFSKRDLPSAPPPKDAVKPGSPPNRSESAVPESISRIEPPHTDSNSAHIRVPHQQTSTVEQSPNPAPLPSTNTGAVTSQPAHAHPLTNGAATSAADAPEDSLSRELVARTATRGLAAVVRQRGGSLTLRLHPASLGSVRIEMSFDAGAVNAQLRATTAQAQQLLESNLSQLRTALESRGLVVDRLSVQLASGVSHSPTNQGGGTHAEQHPENPHTPSSRHDAGDGRSRGGFDRREDPDAEPRDGRTNGAHQDDARGNEAERSFHESYMVRLSAIA